MAISPGDLCSLELSLTKETLNSQRLQGAGTPDFHHVQELGAAHSGRDLSATPTARTVPLCDFPAKNRSALGHLPGLLLDSQKGL